MHDEPKLRVESREELVYLLGEACEIEHGLMCEYLYAQFSLKRSTDEGLTSDQLARVRVWELTLVDIVKQEMLHLALATNILTRDRRSAPLRAPQRAGPVAVVSSRGPDGVPAVR
jgi:Ferritin-like